MFKDGLPADELSVSHHVALFAFDGVEGQRMRRVGRHLFAPHFVLVSI